MSERIATAMSHPGSVIDKDRVTWPDSWEKGAKCNRLAQLLGRGTHCWWSFLFTRDLDLYDLYHTWMMNLIGVDGSLRTHSQGPISLKMLEAANLLGPSTKHVSSSDYYNDISENCTYQYPPGPNIRIVAQRVDNLPMYCFQVSSQFHLIPVHYQKLIDAPFHSWHAAIGNQPTSPFPSAFSPGGIAPKYTQKRRVHSTRSCVCGSKRSSTICSRELSSQLPHWSHPQAPGPGQVSCTGNGHGL